MCIPSFMVLLLDSAPNPSRQLLQLPLPGLSGAFTQSMASTIENIKFADEARVHAPVRLEVL